MSCKVRDTFGKKYSFYLIAMLELMCELSTLETFVFTFLDWVNGMWNDFSGGKSLNL